MATKKSKTQKSHPDFNESAVAAVMGRDPRPVEAPAPRRKNPAAVQLGRLGGIASAKARPDKIPAERRREIAAAAARARWGKRKP